MSPGKILVVEDDPDIAEIVDFILSEKGYHVKCLQRAEHFDNEVREFEPDLLLLDIRLPDGDGINLCQRVKDDTETRDIPVILMSAHARAGDILKESCANAFIAKPFDLDYMATEVAQQIRPTN